MQPSTALTRRRFAATALAAGALAGFPAVVRAEPRTLSFGYDEPHETGYGFFADRFGEKLAELSKGALKIQQYPNAQLGTEPEMAQKVRTGDLDFTINSTGNAAAISPKPGSCRSNTCSPANRSWSSRSSTRGSTTRSAS